MAWYNDANNMDRIPGCNRVFPIQAAGSASRGQLLMTDMRLTALVVDDEPLARAYLKRQLELQSVQVVGEAESAAEAMQLVKDLGPNLLFLDIRLPGLTGLEFAKVIQQFDAVTQIIFVTAHAQYAADAYERDALDYLLKPVPPQRLAASLARARERLADLGAAKRAETHAAAQMRWSSQRLPIRDEYAVRLIPFGEIMYATARDKSIYVATETRQYRADYTLNQLETILPTDRFFRLHSAWLVNLDRVEQLCFLGNHSYVARLTNSEQAPISRYRWAKLRQRLGIDTHEFSPQ
jgi:DNA-binding LytR/AlgR family response regulator